MSIATNIDRENLERLQSSLAEALLKGESKLRGFDAERMQVASQALANKRRREAARAWPTVARWLGNDFASQFDRYSKQTPPPENGGPLADGWAFLRCLEAADRLPSDVRLARYAVDLRYRSRASGLSPRRSPTIRASLLLRPLRLVLGAYWPRRAKHPLVVTHIIGA
jgi:hypothetical protein